MNTNGNQQIHTFKNPNQYRLVDILFSIEHIRKKNGVFLLLMSQPPGDHDHSTRQPPFPPFFFFSVTITTHHV
jgi:hypothetical protein